MGLCCVVNNYGRLLHHKYRFLNLLTLGDKCLNDLAIIKWGKYVLTI